MEPGENPLNKEENHQQTNKLHSGATPGLGIEPKSQQQVSAHTTTHPCSSFDCLLRKGTMMQYYPG